MLVNVCLKMQAQSTRTPCARSVPMGPSRTRFQLSGAVWTTGPASHQGCGCCCRAPRGTTGSARAASHEVKRRKGKGTSLVRSSCPLLVQPLLVVLQTEPTTSERFYRPSLFTSGCPPGASVTPYSGFPPRTAGGRAAFRDSTSRLSTKRSTCG